MTDYVNSDFDKEAIYCVYIKDEFQESYPSLKDAWKTANRILNKNKSLTASDIHIYKAERVF